MNELKEFVEWFRLNAPEDAHGKGELLDVLEKPIALDIYSSRREGAGLTIYKGETRVRLRNKSDLREAASIVDDYYVPDEEDLDEGWERAMDRPSND